jgi:uncharacterized membrane protein YqiK
MPFAGIAWFVITLVVMIALGGFLPFLWRYIVIPAGAAFVMGRLTFEGKRPDRFLQSAIVYWAKPKLTFAGKAIKRRKQREHSRITAVRRIQD